jgi:hypothetical protein
MTPSTPGRRACLARLGACALAAALAWAAPPAGAGDGRDEARGRAGRAAGLIEERARWSALNDVLARETERCEAEARDPQRGPNLLREVREAVQGPAGSEALGRLDGLVRKWSARLSEAAGVQRDETAPLRARWVDVRAVLDDRRRRLAEAERAGSAAGSSAARVHPGARLRSWAALALAPLALLTVAAYDRRQPVRRALHRAGWPRLTLWAPAALLAADTAVWLLAPGPTAPPRRPVPPAGAAAVDDGDAPLRDQVAALRAENSRRVAAYREAVGRWREALGGPDGPTASLLDDWLDARRALADLRAALEVRRAFAGAVVDDLDELARCDAALAARAAGGRPGSGRRALGRLAGWAVPLACLLGLMALGFDDRRRRRLDAATCPRCLSVGTLEPDGAPEPAIAHAEPPVPGLGRVRCHASWGYGEPCGFTAPERVRAQPRLCLPTMGVTQAGKTHWMAALSGELKRSAGKAVLFEEVETQGLAHLRWVLEQIRAGVKVQRSYPVLPDPVIFDFADADAPRPSGALLNLFDYAGEVAQSLDLRHPLRRRMMRADGYFAFLDPTNSGDLQREIYEGFYRDLWEAHEVSQGRPCGVPAAVCLTKIDELPRLLDPARHGAAVAQFFDGLRRVEASRPGGEVTLRLIEARSRVTARLVRELWPRVDIEERLRRLFGRRFRFFPMTPFGLEHLGVAGAVAGSAATAEPFSAQEPLLWMLHACGYVVFRPGARPTRPFRLGPHPHDLAHPA